MHGKHAANVVRMRMNVVHECRACVDHVFFVAMQHTTFVGAGGDQDERDM